MDKVKVRDDFWGQLVSQRFSNCRLVFAYGSGVFEQAGYNLTDSKTSEFPMIDLVAVVDDPESWHEENLVQFSSDYWWPWAKLGSKRIADFQTAYGAGLFYNTHVSLECGRKIKYGVISTRDFKEDLKAWKWLYTAGRMHKPVKFVHSKHPNSDDNKEDLVDTVASNVKSALAASLLLLPQKFSELQLYLTITGLSYGGDFRMKFGENPRKVTNIVSANISHFRRLYIPLIQDLEAMDLVQSEGNFTQKEENLQTGGTIGGYSFRDPGQVMLQQTSKLKQVLACGGEDISMRLGRALTRTVKMSSKAQAVKGLFTAGPQKSLVYGFAKFKKFLK
ncbi:unnamed protein product [Heterosigma akashiwo]